MATLGTLLVPDLMKPGSYWQLHTAVNGYAGPSGMDLVTQAFSGRGFRILDQQEERLKVELLEDGYRCWLDTEAVFGKAEQRGPWQPTLLAEAEIAKRIPAVLAWSERAEKKPNTYLWGGTTEPDMDCSGLMQLAFASQGIWIPRDAYQQERFCRPVAVAAGDVSQLRPGDLIFFGTAERCTHVGLHLGNGRYRHSSGADHGRNGIGIDSLQLSDEHPVARHYRSELRGAGRVVRCHDGNHLA